jgi:TPR repeat protein
MDSPEDLDRLRHDAESGDVDAMAELGYFLDEQGDAAGALRWFQRAAEAGNTAAMCNLGVTHELKGQVREAVKWYTAAAKGGEQQAMLYLAAVLARQGKLRTAERWYRRAAATGDPHSMAYLGFFLRDKRADLGEAETWMRRAAAEGADIAAAGVGNLCYLRGDLREAESWNQRAADGGIASARRSLVTIHGQMGDKAGAAEEARRLVEDGDTESMYLLAYWLNQLGKQEESEVWYRRAADAGDKQAMYGLGLLLMRKRDFDEALSWHERAAAAGHGGAMGAAGTVCKLEGDLDGASTWYQRAVNAGDEVSIGLLAGLRRKIRYTDRSLEMVSFDGFGWQMTRNDDGIRCWSSDAGSLMETFTDLAPDFLTWDPAETREVLVEGFALLHSPDFNFEQIGMEEMPEEMRAALTRLPDQIDVLDVECFEIPPAKCNRIENRHRKNGRVHYSTTMVIVFASCFWVLGLELEADEVVGAREAAVARRRLDDNQNDPLADDSDPYDRRWDGLIAIEDDPLTRMRLLVTRLRESIRLAPELDAFEPFDSRPRG